MNLLIPFILANFLFPSAFNGLCIFCGLFIVFYPLSLMKREIRIDLLAPRNPTALLPPTPVGVQVSAMKSDAVAGPIPLDVVLHFSVTVAKDVAERLFVKWLYERIINYNAKCIRINGYEPKDRMDFERIVGEAIDIGKND